MQKFNTKNVKEYFKTYGCEMLSKEYTGYNDPLKYRCKCGNIVDTSFRVFKNKENKCCRKCAYDIMNENFKAKNNGLHHFQTEKFKKETKQKHLKKYGVDSPLKNKRVLDKLRKTNLERYGCEFVGSLESVKQKIKRTVREKYGVDYVHQNKEVRDKFNKTIQEKYNVPNVAYLSNVASNESQELFDAIYDRLIESQKDKIYYARLNHEFVTTFEQKTYKYDFVSTKLKRCIEYNGYNFHPRPDQDENAIGWCAYHPDKTVKEAREYEAHKYKTLEVRGYKILTIWDYEYKANKKEVVSKCIDFLLGQIVNRSR